MVSGRYLREALRLGHVRFMTAGAEHGRLELGGLLGGGVVGMFRQRAVAGLAVDARVASVLLLVEHVGVAGFAGFRCH